jgi:hypothetical protein
LEDIIFILDKDKPKIIYHTDTNNSAMEPELRLMDQFSDIESLLYGFVGNIADFVVYMNAGRGPQSY